MASEIHRKRTGRSLKVSEEIVLKEEMYEEEEDELPRHYRYLTAHLQTNSPDMNNKVNAYITTQAAMATMARYNEVNRLFSESFPTAQGFHSMYMAPLMNKGQVSPPLLGRGSSSPAQSTPISPTNGPGQSHIGSFDRRPSVADSLTSNVSAISSPPALSPSSSATPESRNTPYQAPASTFPTNLQLDPQLVQQTPSSSASIFTSELSNEVKLMANIDMNDPMAVSFLGGDPSSWAMFSQFPGETLKQHSGKEFQHSDRTNGTPNGFEMPPYTGDTAFLFPSMEASVDRLDVPVDSHSRIGTPGCGGGSDTWESFVDFGTEH